MLSFQLGYFSHVNCQTCAVQNIPFAWHRTVFSSDFGRLNLPYIRERHCLFLTSKKSVMPVKLRIRSSKDVSSKTFSLPKSLLCTIMYVFVLRKTFPARNKCLRCEIIALSSTTVRKRAVINDGVECDTATESELYILAHCSKNGEEQRNFPKYFFL